MLAAHRGAGGAAAADSTVRRHDRYHDTVDLLCRSLLIRLDVPDWVGADEDVVQYPAEYGMPTGGNASL